MSRVVPVISLAAGFLGMSVMSFSLVHAVGRAAAEVVAIDVIWRLIALGIVAFAIGAVDVLRGSRGPLISWKRQTSRKIYYSWGPGPAALVWGGDAGLGFTTYRVTSLVWLGFLAVFLQLLPWWSGIGYGLGFVTPFVVQIVMLGRSSTTRLSSYSKHGEFFVRGGAVACLLTGVAALVLAMTFS